MPAPGPERWTLAHWEKMFSDIYGDRNRASDKEQIWARMVEEVGELVDPMDKEKIREIENGIPDLFAWMMAFTHKSGIDLQAETWKKFQKGCPSCGAANDCTCGIVENTHGKPERKRTVVEAYKKEPSTLDEWQSFFAELYGKANERDRPLSLLTRLTEDIGGVARALRKRLPADEIGWKLGSVLAWLLAICNRYSATGKGEFKLSELVWKKYEYRCPSCMQPHCKCVILGSLFISYAKELEAEMMELKSLAEKEFGLKVYVFPDLGPDFSKSGRMPAAFDAIDVADAAIILLGKTFSPRVYAEAVEIMHKKFREYVFPYAKEETGRDAELSELIKELRMIHRCTGYRDSNELRELVRRDMEQAREISRRLSG